MPKTLIVTDDRVRAAAEKCTDAKRVLKELFPEAFHVNYPLNAGDVYRKELSVPQLLVQVAWNKDEWQLIGHGAYTNSDPFYCRTHTKAEILDHLSSGGWVFAGNYRNAIAQIISEARLK